MELIYDPNHPDPKTSIATVKVAAFLPHYRKFGGKGSKHYIAVVGRHGIKWPLRELAAVLVHELVGHGTQHLKGRFTTMRNVELDCEAWLYAELAYQDFRCDKSSREMIEFRQQLEGVGFTPGNCTEFKRHMRKNNPDRMKLWESLNPNVPRLLAVFEDYLRDLRETGVTGAALAAVEQLSEAERQKIYNEGSPEEQYQVALMQLSGLGKKPDLAAAAKWYQRAAEGGHARAQYVIAVIYDNGQGVPRDRAEAAKGYRKAGEKGHYRAQYTLGVMFKTGTGVKKDPGEAAKWMRLAADQGQASVRYELAVMYEEGDGVVQDHVAAAKWFREAAQQKYVFAQYRLGRLYWYGRGVSKDYSQSAKWYRKAAEQGHARSQTALGYLLVHGHGIAQDFAEAAEWYRKAADQGSALAQYRLGKLYSSGQGVVKDQYTAYFWVILAIERAQGKLKKRAVNKKKRLIKYLEPARISEIEDRAGNWRPK